MLLGWQTDGRRDRQTTTIKDDYESKKLLLDLFDFIHVFNFRDNERPATGSQSAKSPTSERASLFVRQSAGRPDSQPISLPTSIQIKNLFLFFSLLKGTLLSKSCFDTILLLVFLYILHSVSFCLIRSRWPVGIGGRIFLFWLFIFVFIHSRYSLAIITSSITFTRSEGDAGQADEEMKIRPLGCVFRLLPVQVQLTVAQ